MFVALPLACFVVAAFAHAAFARLPTRLNIVVKFILPATALGLALICALVSAYGVDLATLSGVLLYGLLCELYIFSFTFVISSVSAKILVSMLEGPMTSEGLQSSYDVSDMVTQRMTRLETTGLIRQEGSAIRLTPKGRALYRSFLQLKRFFGH